MIELPQSLKLISGVGKRAEETACVMSAAAWIGGKPENVGDAPPCVSSVIRQLAIRLNDGPWWQSDAERTEVLLPLAYRLVGTAASREVEAKRVDLALHRALCVWTPDALESAASALEAKLPDRAAELRKHAKILREFPREKLKPAAAAARYAAAAAARYAAAAAADAADAARYAADAAAAAADAARHATAARYADAADAAAAAARYAAAADAARYADAVDAARYADAAAAAARYAVDAADTDPSMLLRSRQRARDQMLQLIDEMIAIT